MAVNHHCRTPGPMFIARPDDGMTFRGYKLRLQTDLVELVHQPLCAFDQFFFVLVVSRDARKPQKRIILFEIIVAHGERVNPRSYERPILKSHARNSCGAGASPAQPMTWQAERLPCKSMMSPIHMLRTRDCSTHEVQERRKRQHNSSHKEFTKRGVRQNPNNRKNRQRRNNVHSGKIERLT